MRLFLEGNIGAGKSSFLKVIKKHLPEIEVYQEKHDSWMQPVDGVTLLDLYHQDPSRWTYTMELAAMAARVKDHLEQQKTNGSLLAERSLYSSYYCFARYGVDRKAFSQAELTAYRNWFETLVLKQCLLPDGFIYLKADPKICLERKNNRGRDCEQGVSLEYLQAIDQYHDDIFLGDRSGAPELSSVPVLTFDVNKPFVGDIEREKELAMKVQSFMKSLSLSSTDKNKEMMI